MVTLESLDGIVGQIKVNMGIMEDYLGRDMEKEESVCLDCQRDKDDCPDCDNGDKYISPNLPNPRENR
jgi:hypothetical protein